MANVMTRAWEIARVAATTHGGKASEYIADALRMAWAESRRPKLVTVELRQPNRKQKTWVARIVGTHPVYKFERKFVNPEGWGSTEWRLEEGTYEFCENGKRYFVRIADGEVTRIDASEVA